MKVRMSEFPKRLKIHPVNLIPYFVSIGVSFDDVWPEIEESLIDTIRSLDREKFKEEELSKREN